MPINPDRSYDTVEPLLNKDQLRCHPDLMTAFRTKSNTHVTISLFKEIPTPHFEYAVYTLDDRDFTSDGKVYYSAKKLFLEEGDVTGYQFATKWLDGWDHLQKILKSKKFLPVYEGWVQELEVKLRSEGLREVIKLSSAGNYNASKLLIDKGWAQKRGRPSKEEVQGARAQEARIKDEIDEDLQRVGLRAVK